MTCASKPTAFAAALRVMRVGAWVEHLGGRTGELGLYSLGRRVQPEIYRSEEGDLQNDGRYSQYYAGRRAPSAATLREVDAACARASAANLRKTAAVYARPSALFLATAWDAFDLHAPLRAEWRLRQLRHDVQVAVFEPKWLKLGQHVRRKNLTQSLHLLLGGASLDALAAAVVLLREALAAGNGRRVLRIGRVLHTLLLAAVTQLPLAAIALELFEFFNRVIFPLVSDGSFRLHVTRRDFFRRVRLLTMAVEQLRDGDVRQEWGTTYLHRRLLSGRYGESWSLALGPAWRRVTPAIRRGHAVQAVLRRRRRSTQLLWLLSARVLGERPHRGRVLRRRRQHVARTRLGQSRLPHAPGQLPIVAPQRSHLARALRNRAPRLRRARATNRAGPKRSR